MQKENERFQALFEYASLGIVLCDANGKIEMVNNFLLSQFGYQDKEELEQQNIELLIPMRYKERHVKHRGNYSHHPERRSMGIGRDLFGLKKDGTEFPVEVSLSPYSDEYGTHVIAFVIDITLRKKIEQDVLQKQEELEQTNTKIEELNNELEAKVQERTSQLQDAMIQIEASRDELSKALSKEKELGDLKSRFVSMASHEFRTPLSTILSSASLLAKYTRSEEQEKRDKHIQRIKNSVNTLTDILNEFLSIGRIEDGKIAVRYSTFNVKEFVGNLCTEMSTHARSNQKIEYSHSGEELLTLDESLLRNILFNLLSNAIKFSNDEGLIKVSTVQHEEGFTLVVADQGIGISKEDQQHLFERFFRAANVTNIQGTGLGLHIVAKYTELMNGNIQFSSELDKGTTITIHFEKQVN
ncbi:MAG: PAS domain-containing sensor histidine kinase [Ferruginibacter sp.]